MNKYEIAMQLNLPQTSRACNPGICWSVELKTVSCTPKESWWWWTIKYTDHYFEFITKINHRPGCMLFSEQLFCGELFTVQ